MGAVQEVGSSVLLFALVFGMSATVDIDHLKKQLSNKNALLTGIFLQFAVLPFLGFAVVKAIGLSAPMGITLLVVTSSPGGSYSNWWCSIFNADLALSVTMTAISTLMSLLMLPVNLIIYTTNTYSSAVVKNLDWGALFVSLIIVIGAIGCGLLCSAKVHSHKFNLLANKLGNMSGIALVVLSIVVSSSDKNAELWDRDWTFYLAVAAPCILGLVIANFITFFFKLELPERVTVSVECCYQNVGIATSVAINMFEGDDLAEAIGVPLFYGIVEAITLGFYCIGAWKFGWTKAPKDENICVVIGTSYEVEEAERHDPGSIEVVLGLDKDGLPSDLIFQFDESEGYIVDETSLELSEIRTSLDEESSFGNEEKHGEGGLSLVADAFARACDNYSVDDGSQRPLRERSTLPSTPDGEDHAKSTGLPSTDEPGNGAVSLSGDVSSAVPAEGIRSASSSDDVPATPAHRNRMGLPRRKQHAYHRASLSSDDVDTYGNVSEDVSEEDLHVEDEFDSSMRTMGRRKYERLQEPSGSREDARGESKEEPRHAEDEDPPLPAEEHRID